MFLRIAILLFYLVLNSCYRANDAQFYDDVGFDSGGRPTTKAYGINAEPPVKVAPDYYYSQPYSSQYGAPPNPYSQQQYSPSSRSYSNPYSFQPPAQYPYYDSDRYYVPPTFYQGNEYPNTASRPFGNSQ